LRKSEEKAYKFLSRLGEVTYSKSTPAFQVNNRFYEAKRGVVNSTGAIVVAMSRPQLEAIKRKDAALLVFTDDSDEPIMIPPSKINTGLIKIGNRSVLIKIKGDGALKDYVSVKIPREMHALVVYYQRDNGILSIEDAYCELLRHRLSELGYRPRQRYGFSIA